MITPLEVYSAEQDNVEACMNEFNRYQKAVEGKIDIKVISVESVSTIAVYHTPRVMVNIYFIREIIKEEESQDILSTTVDGNSNKMSNLYCTCGQQPCDCPSYSSFYVSMLL